MVTRGSFCETLRWCVALMSQCKMRTLFSKLEGILAFLPWDLASLSSSSCVPPLRVRVALAALSGQELVFQPYFMVSRSASLCLTHKPSIRLKKRGIKIIRIYYVPFRKNIQSSWWRLQQFQQARHWSHQVGKACIFCVLRSTKRYL